MTLEGDGWERLQRADREVLSAWAQSEDLLLEACSWFDSGRSGEPVGVVRIGVAGRFVRQAVMKFYRKNPVVSLDALERCRQACSGGFLKHLVLDRQPPVMLRKSWLTVQEVAGGDLTAMLPLTDLLLAGAPVAALLEIAMRSMIGDWNTEENAHLDDIPVSRFILGILGDRAGEPGNIPKWANSHGISFSAIEATIDVPGSSVPLPNPFRLINDWPASATVIPNALFGWGHGDLSGRNLLIRSTPLTADDFLLIDLDRASKSSAIARDPMHLLVALALNQFESADADNEQRSAMIDALVHPDLAQEIQGHNDFAAISTAVHRGSSSLARARGIGADWLPQCLAALVAAALMHLDRQLMTKNPDRDKWWCLQLAGEATAALDAHLNILDRVGSRARADDGVAKPSLNLSVHRDRLRVLVVPSTEQTVTVQELEAHLADESVQLRLVNLAETVTQTSLLAQLASADVLLCTGPIADRVKAGLRDVRGAALVLGPSIVDLTTRRSVHSVQVEIDANWTQIDISDNQGWATLRALLSDVASPEYLVRRCRQRRALTDVDARRGHIRAKYRADYDLAYWDQRIEDEENRSKGSPVQIRTAVRAPKGSQATSTSPLRVSGEPPALPTGSLLNRNVETRKLIELINDGVRAIGLQGRNGIGRTAVVAEILRLRRLSRANLPIDAFAYISPREPQPVDLEAVLLRLAHLMPEPDASILVDRCRSRALTWRQKVDDVKTQLDGTRVLLVIDDIHDLCDGDVDRSRELEMRDRELAQALNELIAPGSPVQLLAVGMPLPVDIPLGSDPVSVHEGLKYEHAWELLRGVDWDDHLGLDDATAGSTKRRLQSLTRGIPANLALMAALMFGDASLGVEDALDRAQGCVGSSAAGALMSLVMTTLDRVERATLQALAVYERPVTADAVDFLLEPCLPGAKSALVLQELRRRSLVRGDEHTFGLHRHVDVTTLLSPMQAVKDVSEVDPLSVRGFRLRAAAYFAKHPDFAAERLSDLQNTFSQIALRIEAADITVALKLLSDVEDEYLRDWGAMWAVRAWRADPRLELQDDGYHVLQNLSRQAAGYLQAGEADQAVGLLDNALDLAVEFERPESYKVLELQLGDALLADGHLALAQEAYEDAAGRGDGMTPAAAAGVARAAYQQGDLDAALRQCASVLALSEGDSPENTRVRASVLLTEGLTLGLLGQQRLARSSLMAAQDACAGDHPFLLAEIRGAQATLFVDAGLPRDALNAAAEASAYGSRSGNVRLIREAATTLALAGLCLGDNEAAEKAARLAASYSEQPTAVGPYIVLGICQHRRGANNEAAGSWSEASRRAEALLVRDAKNWEAYDLAGLAQTGMSLTGRPQLDHLETAIRRFGQARQLVEAEGVAGRLYRLLRLMVRSTEWTETRGRVEAAALGRAAHQISTFRHRSEGP